MANEFVAKNGLISQNNTTISGSLTVSASSGIPLQIKGGTGTLLSVSSSTSEIFKISDTFSPNLFTVSTGSIAVFNIDNTNRVVISGSLIATQGITGSLQGTSSFATTASIASSVVGATPTEVGYLSGVTDPIQPQINNISDVAINTYKALGSTIKAQTIGLTTNSIIAAVALQATTATQISRMQVIPIYLQTTEILSGVIWYNGTGTGTYVASNENRVGLYSYSGGTLTLLASSTNDPTMWSSSYNAANSFVTKSFSSTYSASPGLYYIGVLQSFASATSVPTVGSAQNIISSALTFRLVNFTNGAVLTGVKTTVTSLPGSVAINTFTNTYQNNHWFAVYST
jgi:hypothetical protein